MTIKVYYYNVHTELRTLKSECTCFAALLSDGLMFKVAYNIIIFIVPCVRNQPLNYKTIVPNFICEVIILIHRKTTRLQP